MKPPKFDYFAPETIEEAITLMVRLGENARFLAGGQSLVPMLNFRVAAPSALIDLNQIATLREIRLGVNGDLRLGAMVRIREIETDPVIGSANPLLQAAAINVAHAQIRNRGTIGGSLSHADPAAELPGIALVCGANIRLRGPDGTRTVAAIDFFDGIFSTNAGEEEIVTEIIFLRWPENRHWAFREISRREGDFAMIGVAAWFDLDVSGQIEDARIVAIGAGDTPILLPSAQAALLGRVPDDTVIAEAAQAGIADLQPGSDIHATAEYRREVGGVLIGRVLADARERCA